MEEVEILERLNDVAVEYHSSKNLIKNINKRYSGLFKVVSCEMSGAGYRVVSIIDKDNETLKFKLYEANEMVEFKLFSSKDNYTINDLWDILKTGKIERSIHSITITLDDLSMSDMEIMLKGLGLKL